MVNSPSAGDTTVIVVGYGNLGFRPTSSYPLTVLNTDNAPSFSPSALSHSAPRNGTIRSFTVHSFIDTPPGNAGGIILRVQVFQTNATTSVFFLPIVTVSIPVTTLDGETVKFGSQTNLNIPYIFGRRYQVVVTATPLTPSLLADSVEATISAGLNIV